MINFIILFIMNLNDIIYNKRIKLNYKKNKKIKKQIKKKKCVVTN